MTKSWGRLLLFAIIFSSFWSLQNAKASVEILPQNAKANETHTFELAVVSERNMGTVGIKLEIPREVVNVIPHAKEGWRIEVKRDINQNVREIIWSGNEIAKGGKASFFFSARILGGSKEISWPTYQVYSDAEIGSWDISPKINLAMVNRSGLFNFAPRVSVTDGGVGNSTEIIAIFASFFALLVSAATLAITENKLQKIKIPRSRPKSKIARKR